MSPPFELLESWRSNRIVEVSTPACNGYAVGIAGRATTPRRNEEDLFLNSILSSSEGDLAERAFKRGDGVDDQTRRWNRDSVPRDVGRLRARQNARQRVVRRFFRLVTSLVQT